MSARSGNAPLNVESVTAAGSVQSDAAAIPSKSSPAFVLATGDGTVGISLPKATKGKLFYVKNLAAGSALKVWPATGDAINALSANSAISMAAATSAVFIAKDSTTWYTVPLLPS